MNLSRIRTVQVLLVVLAAVACNWRFVQAQASKNHAAAEEPWKTIEENWYEITMAGARVGWTKSLLQERDDQLQLVSESKLSFKRGSVSVDMEMNAAFVEHRQGKPIRLESTTKMAQQRMHTRLDFMDDHALLTTSQGTAIGRSVPKETTKRIERPQGEWLAPIAAEMFARSQRKSGAKQFTYRMLDPQSGNQLVNISSAFVQELQAEVDGKQTTLQVWRTTNDLLNIPSEEHFLPDGRLYMSKTSLGGTLPVVQALSTREQLLEKDNDRNANPPHTRNAPNAPNAPDPAPDLLFDTVVQPDRPIEHPMQTKFAKLRLTAKQGELPDLPTAGSQSVQQDDQKKAQAVVIVDINNPQPAKAEELDDRSFIEPSAMVDSMDDLVVKLAQRAIAPLTRTRNGNQEPTALAKADVLRDFVRTHVSHKNLSTAFASASETAKTRQGDCSEHAVLLCAMLRSQNIPARVASGLVYADVLAKDQGAFAWHMWTQALIDGKWVDLDATLPVRYHAGHILTGVSALADGRGMGELASMLQLLGNLEIQVLDVR